MGKIYTERKNGEGTNITFPYRSKLEIVSDRENS